MQSLRQAATPLSTPLHERGRRQNNNDGEDSRLNWRIMGIHFRLRRTAGIARQQWVSICMMTKAKHKFHSVMEPDEEILSKMAKRT